MLLESVLQRYREGSLYMLAIGNDDKLKLIVNAHFFPFMSKTKLNVFSSSNGGVALVEKVVQALVQRIAVHQQHGFALLHRPFDAIHRLD
jgi:hypothetical protein